MTKLARLTKDNAGLLRKLTSKDTKIGRLSDENRRLLNINKCLVDERNALSNKLLKTKRLL